MEWPEITINTPLSEVQEIHKRIWDYVIEHGEKPDTPYDYDCALCEYANCVRIVMKTGGFICKWCPYAYQKPEDGIDPSCLNGLYALFDRCDEDNLSKRTALARQIRDIPFKEEGYWKEES